MIINRLEDFLIRSANNFPQQLAIECMNEEITYQQLINKSKKIAANLLVNRKQSGERVVILIDKSIDAITAMYGILLADCTYVPVDVNQPSERINKIITDCEATHVIVSSSEHLKLENALNIIDITNLKDIPFEENINRQSNLAYILYTSGSTGTPKGVKITHKNAINFITWVVDTFSITTTDRLANHAGLFFDISVLDIYCACAAGASVFLLPNLLKLFPIKLAEWIVNRKITIWYSVPTALINLTNRGKISTDTLRRLRCIFFAGEPYPYDELKKLKDKLLNTTLVNLYGPTETNVCSYFILPNELNTLPNHEIPIGNAISHTNLFIMDENNVMHQEPGSLGELCCTGDCVSPGYWDTSLSDNKKFQYFDIDGKQVFGYRTGDLVKKTKQGYVYLSRIDRQIKLNGFRIDPTEIEMAIRTFSLIESTAVVFSQNQLIAFVALAPNATSFELNSLVDHLIKQVPKYMLPEKYIIIKEIPLTKNGKTDYKKLESQLTTTVENL